MGQKKSGAVESTLLTTFVERLNIDDHKQRWYMLGHGDVCVRFIRTYDLLNVNNRIPTA